MIVFKTFLKHDSLNLDHVIARLSETSLKTNKIYGFEVIDDKERYIAFKLPTIETKFNFIKEIGGRIEVISHIRYNQLDTIATENLFGLVLEVHKMIVSKTAKDFTHIKFGFSMSLCRDYRFYSKMRKALLKEVFGEVIPTVTLSNSNLMMGYRILTEIHFQPNINEECNHLQSIDVVLNVNFREPIDTDTLTTRYEYIVRSNVSYFTQLITYIETYKPSFIERLLNLF